MHWAGLNCRFCKLLLVALAILVYPVLASPPGETPTSSPSAHVSETLRKESLFNQYAAMMVRIELLSRPVTASLPISVSNPEPGVLALDGTVNNDRIRRLIMSDAKRVSGLAVRDQMVTGNVKAGYFVEVKREELETMTIETVAGLFPELAEKVRVEVAEGGVVHLRGLATSYDERVLLSQAIKSQPGCSAVVNHLQVEADDEGLVAIAAGEKLLLSQLPAIPVAPEAPMIEQASATLPAQADSKRKPTSEKGKERSSIRELTKQLDRISRPVAGDDSPEDNIKDRQLREDIEANIAEQPKYSDSNITVEVRSGTATISGKLERRELVESLSDLIAGIPGVSKFVIQGKPFVIQRTVQKQPKKTMKLGSDEEKEPAKEKSSASWWTLPWLNSGNTEDTPWRDRRLIGIVRGSLKKRAEGRMKNTSVHAGVGRLVIEGETANSRDRRYLFSQIDEIAELRGIPYEVIMRVKEPKKTGDD